MIGRSAFQSRRGGSKGRTRCTAAAKLMVMCNRRGLYQPRGTWPADDSEGLVAAHGFNLPTSTKCALPGNDGLFAPLAFS